MTDLAPKAEFPPCGFRQLVAPGFVKREKVDPLTWMEENIRFPEGWESEIFDKDIAPHVPGFLERFWLDPTKRKANLMWATRLVKTSTMISLIGHTAATEPAPMALLFPDEDIRDASLDEQIYPILEATRVLSEQIQPVHKRNRIAVRFANCRVRLAYAGSKSSTSGYPAQKIFKMEHDKTGLRKSSEADASLRIESRCSGFDSGVKILEESTPSDVDTSRAWQLYNDPHVQRVAFQVPCPHCSEFQILDFKTGVKWEKTKEGANTPALAFRTAYYECRHCKGRVDNHHREPMMQRGQWVIEGESVDPDGTLRGEPKVDSDTMIFGPLSKLYSLLIGGWGDVAREFVTAKHAADRGNTEPLRKFNCETLGVPWDPSPERVEVNVVAERLKGEHLKGTCPAGTAFLTTAVDLGAVGNTLLFHWQTVAWRRGAQGSVVDFGLATGRDEFLALIESAKFPVEGHPIALPMMGHPLGVDSGSFTSDIYTLCDEIPFAIPVKGDTARRQNIDLYSWGNRHADQEPGLAQLKRAAGIGDLLMVNSQLSQSWRQSLTEARLIRGLPGFVDLPRDVCYGWKQYSQFLDQLTNDAEVAGKWIKLGPNEHGDALRYNRALAELYTRNGLLWSEVMLEPRFQVQKAKAPQRHDKPKDSLVRRTGSAFLISQR